MPIIYLSPSTQESNPYITGSGSEEYNMNLLADAMVPYLLSNGIRWSRNTPDMTAAESIRQANKGYYDFYLALHSNASGQGEASPVRGVIAFYYPGSADGERAANIFVDNLPRFPAVLLELGYHDNWSDAYWIENNMDEIAQNLVLSLTEYFGLPFIYPMEPRSGTVRVNYGTLTLRSYPSTYGTVIANMPNGSTVTVYGQWQGWYVVHYGDLVGYASGDYIQLN